MLAGLAAPDAGRLQLGGQVFEPQRWLTPAGARKLKLAHVPEDRHRRGLVLAFAARESAVLGYARLARHATSGWARRPGCCWEGCSWALGSACSGCTAA
jgi:simple sugar transport system ATP-binding protein